MIHNYFIDTLLLTLFVILFYKSNIQKPFGTFNKEYLSVGVAKYYRGFFAVGIVLHHLIQRSVEVASFHFFSTAGTFFVAFFFFLSGYGLQKSYILKGESYKKNFLRKRLSAILIPYLIISAIYWLVYCLIEGNYLSISNIIIETLKGHPLITFSWYIITILIFYLVYWLLMIICKEHYLRMIIAGVIWWLLYVLVCKRLQFESWWYLSTHLLIVGMTWATYEKNILSVVEKGYIVIAPVIWFLAFLLIYLPQLLPFISIPLVEKNLIYLTTILFVLSVVLLAMKIRIGNTILQFLGEISLEIYLMQELFLELVPKQLFPNSNEFLWATTILAATICSSYPLHMLFQLILKKYRMVILSKDQ